jgi:hypothetical protein
MCPERIRNRLHLSTNLFIYVHMQSYVIAVAIGLMPRDRKEL